MKMTIYMKSGNTIHLKNIKDYTIGNTGNEITKIELTQKDKFLGIFKYKKLLIKTIAMDQIEAVTIN